MILVCKLAGHNELEKMRRQTRENPVENEENAQKMARTCNLLPGG